MHSKLSRRAATAIAIALAVLTTACGSDTATPTTDADTNNALAQASRIDASVDARIADATDYTDIAEPTPVNPGDNVRTDTTGFAEITYFDGSLTRLDINTDFTVTELINNPGDSTIRTQMGLGRTWHRVQTLTGNDTYQVDTSVATAVVRGTAFVIECTPTACTFTVIEGTIEITTTDDTTIELTAGQTITIENNNQPLEPTTITNPLDDPWLNRNNTLDTNNTPNTNTPDTEPEPDTTSEPPAEPLGPLPDGFDGEYRVTIGDVEFVEQAGGWVNGIITMDSERTFTASYVDGPNSGSVSGMGVFGETIWISCADRSCIVETPFPYELVESDDGWTIEPMLPVGESETADTTCGSVSSLRGPFRDIEIVDGVVQSFTYAQGAGSSVGEGCDQYWTARFIVTAERV